MAALFLVAVAVQYNDPDPLRWIALYGAAVIASLLSTFNRLHVAVPLIIGGVGLAWALLLAPGVIGKVSFGELFETVKMHSAAIEQGREMGGLLIVAAWMAVLVVLSLRRQAG
jgi:hypothetical protein